MGIIQDFEKVGGILHEPPAQFHSLVGPVSQLTLVPDEVSQTILNKGGEEDVSNSEKVGGMFVEPPAQFTPVSLVSQLTLVPEEVSQTVFIKGGEEDVPDVGSNPMTTSHVGMSELNRLRRSALHFLEPQKEKI